jgi:hypothetical protein
MPKGYIYAEFEVSDAAAWGAFDRPALFRS